MEKQGNGKSQTIAPAVSPQETTMTEAPYSANFHARHSNGFEFQFTVRTATEDGLVLRLDRLIGRLLQSGYEPGTRWKKPQTPRMEEGNDGSLAVEADASALTAPLFDGFEAVEEEPLFPDSQQAEERITRCPQCGSGLWDNRHDPNRKPRAPLMKCKNPNCDWRLWPARESK